MPPTHSATMILGELAEGDASAAGRLLPLVYAELRALASSYVRRQGRDHTLQPTALVHEAFIRLIGQEDGREGTSDGPVAPAGSQPWRSRAHFMAVAATAMRQILADHARRRRADKRGGDWQRITLEQVGADGSGEIDIVALDDCLAKLAELDPRRHRVVELRFFGGLSVDDTAMLLGISRSTAEADWRSARAWLSAQLGD